MDLKKSLDFLALAKDYEIDKSPGGDDWDFKVSEKDGDLVAFHEKGRFNYYVSGVYNSGGDFAYIDIKRLGKLVAFCKYLEEQSK